MKTSDYPILLLALVIIYGSFILEKPKNVLSISNSEKVFMTTKVDHFSVIVAQPNSKIFIQAPYPVVDYPTFRSGRDKRYYLPPSYIIRNDTLFVFACSSKIEYTGDIFYCNRIRSIIGMAKSDLHVSYLQADTLSIKLCYSKLFIDFDTRNKFLKQLNIKADSSRIDLRAVAFEDINLQMYRSHLKLETSFVKSKVKGTLRNFSRLYISGRPDIAISKDETSYSPL
jgi:hypothetical protein